MSVNKDTRPILVVEDDPLIGLSLIDQLVTAGAEVVGPVGNLARAMQIASQADLAGAILDVNIDNDQVWPVALKLKARGIPFVFASATHEREFAAHGLADSPRFPKPYALQDVTDALLALIEGARSKTPTDCHAHSLCSG